MNQLLWIIDFTLAAIFSLNLTWLLVDHFRRKMKRRGVIDFVEDNFQGEAKK